MYVYINSGSGLYTVGFYEHDGKWVAESDHEDKEDAAKRVAWLNGSGGSTQEKKQVQVVKSLKELAQEAITIQHACNLSGLVHAWPGVIESLRSIHPATLDTTELARHPINKMWAYKIYSLSCGEPYSHKDDQKFNEAYAWCRNQVAIPS